MAPCRNNPAKFNSLRFLNDPRHLCEVEESNKKTRTANVAFIENGNLLHRSEFTSYTVPSVKATRSICTGENLFSRTEKTTSLILKQKDRVLALSDFPNLLVVL